MGPRLFSRGNSTYSGRGRTNTNALQWGRGFSAAEMHPPGANPFADLTLQWGRGFSAAEMGYGSEIYRRVWRLQWGRGFSAAEIALIYVLVFLPSSSHTASTFHRLYCYCHRYLRTHLLQHLSFAHYEPLFSLTLDTMTRTPAYHLLVTTPLALLMARASSIETVYITRGRRSSSSTAIPNASNFLIGWLSVGPKSMIST